MNHGVFILWNTVAWQKWKKIIATYIKMDESQKKKSEKSNNITCMQNESTHPKF